MRSAPAPKSASCCRSLQSAELEEIEGGDHSFKVPGGAARQEPVLSRIMDTVAAWARRNAARRT